MSGEEMQNGEKEKSPAPDQAREKTDLAGERTDLAHERTDLAGKRTEKAGERTGWAEERTEWARNRTVLANERTFSAWLRTGLSAMGGGLAVVEFLGGERESVAAVAIGILLVVLGAAMLILALWRFLQVSKVMEMRGLHVTPRWVAAGLTGGLLVIAFILMYLIVSR